MILQIVICKKCLQAFNGNGSAKETYEYICKEYIHNNAVYCHQGFFGRGAIDVAFLEKKGFVVTTEFNKIIAIKPIGYTKTIKGDCELHEICAFKNEH